MTHPTVQRFWRIPGIGMRLLIAQTAVLLAGAITTWLVAAVVGPPLFREHLHRAGVPSDSAEELHAEEAYQYATMLSLAGAVIVAAATAILVTWYVSRRLQRSVAEVAAAASAVADGRYSTRVPPPRLGADFDSLAHAFNHMAAQLQAVDANRRQLFSDLAHEIRTPVSVLDAYIEAVEDGVRSLTPDTTAMLRDQTRRLVRFAEDVAALAQAEEGAAAMSMAQLDIAEVILGTTTAVSDRFHAKRVSLDTDLPPSLAPVYGDGQRLAQVLANLLDNALRHTPPHGTVSVNARTRGDRILLQVTDTGDGIPPQHLPHVFDRLYRADPARTRDHGGSGLGLSITKAIIEAHSGAISVESPSSTGHTTFTITLPTYTAQRDRPPID
ncbi:sensor histidine kinase [Mycolicibacterium goodii]|uniref:histidine kinase n=1 Tax=Mycolicibacterium goodii TaxID=134601 RepID=A0ABS6HM63_MYCGD|nr:ATP-binding protein [Mycolicibacterium goodii]MBU8822774.1 HAMP domain-containing protein [Mycolicibacterium goodii]MBU8838868.1 HAMP domain-containing protein [Mycolicibacterium goodii]